MLSELCHDLRNYFETEKFLGEFKIEDNSITGNYDLQDGQYFRIVGSVFNDGVYCYDDNLKLDDETFFGAIWAMAIPDEVIALASEIDEWNELYGKPDSTNMSPFNSESFGGYSYSKSGGGATSDGAGTWQKAFASRLNRWRRI